MHIGLILLLTAQFGQSRATPIVTEFTRGRCVIVMQNVHVGGSFNVTGCEGVDPRAVKRLNAELVQKKVELRQAQDMAEKFAAQYRNLETLLQSIRTNPANRQKYELALEYLHGGDLERARTILLELRDEDRKHVAEDDYGAALTYSLDFNPQQEFPLIEEAYRLGPSEPSYANEYARVLISENKY